MSQSTLTPIPEEVEPEPAATTPRPASNEFDYRPVPILAPVTFFLGLASFSSLMGVFGWGIAVLGVVVGIVCLITISRSATPLSGKPLAIFGMVLCVAFLSLGVHFEIEDYRAELPPGYTRVNFPRDIAAKKFINEDGQRKLHPDVQPLIDQSLYLKGYIWVTKQSTGLTNFVLLKDNGECCFGGSPAEYDFIEVTLADGQTFDADTNTGLVGVAGVLKANPGAYTGQPVYTMTAKHIAKAKTAW